MSGIFINSDAWNFWLLPEEKMNQQGIRDDVDFYTGCGGVEAVFYNMNFQRTYYPTKTGTPYWKDLEIAEDGTLLLCGKKVDPENDAGDYLHVLRNLRKMQQTCPDYMAFRYRYCHEKGVEMWHSMRMNDVHHTTRGCEHRPQHSDLWQARKDLLRAWYRHDWRNDWHDNTFDYGQREVYEYHLELLREYLMDFESDGIELDWLRALPVFKPGFDEYNTPILTQFMRDVRQIADAAAVKWGHRLRIAVRVPLLVDEAMGAGMDVPTWCREKLIDVLIPGPNNACSEHYVPVSLWRLLAPAPVILAPCIDYYSIATRGYGFPLTFETDCGYASTFYQQGADTIYFYNHFYTLAERCPWVPEMFSIAGDRKAVSAHPRRHVVTKHDPTGEGKFERCVFPPAIWRECCNGGVKIHAGEGNVGREAKIIFGATCPLNVDILLNTVKCPVLSPDTPLPDLPLKNEVHYVSASVPAGILHDGWNVVEIFNHDEHTILDSEMVWLEIYVQ